MKLKPLVEKLEQSGAYKDFKVKYPASFMVAGFFVLDLEEGANIHQIDFYVPSEKKIAAFTMDGEITVKLLETLDKKKIPEKLDMKTKIDLDAIQGILTDEMRNRGMSENIKKIIAVIQNIDGKRIWNLNCVLTGMEILKSHVEDESKTVLKIEKASVMEIMKKMPSPKLLNAPTAQEGTEEELEGELGKLDKIEEEIEKAKAKLKDELQEKKNKKVAKAK